LSHLQGHCNLKQGKYCSTLMVPTACHIDELDTLLFGARAMCSLEGPDACSPVECPALCRDGDVELEG
jgi:hypothetical protein